MESCQDLDILIVVSTIICVLQIICLCLLKKTRLSSRLYGDTQDSIRKPARIINGTKMDSVQWQISRKQPIEHDEQPF